MENFVAFFLRSAAHTPTPDLQKSHRHFKAMLSEGGWQHRAIRLKDCTVRVVRSDMRQLLDGVQAILLARAASGADPETTRW